MDEPGDPPTTTAAALVEELTAQQKVLAAAQARQAALMMEFGQVRRGLDERRITDRAAAGIEQRYRPGEFAAIEIGMAVTASKFSVQRTVGVALRLREEAPNAWDAWLCGDIDLRKATRINQALLRLVRDDSKALLNRLVVPVAACKTAELLGRWLNQFVAKVEPAESDERLRRSFDDRYASIRPDLDGISFLSAALSSVDANAVDQVLNALAGITEPEDPRTVQQRRADALVDLLLGRTSNGCHVIWEDDDTAESDTGQEDEHGDQDADGHQNAGSRDAEPSHSADHADDREMVSAHVEAEADDSADAADDAASRPWDPDDDWDLPASAFRPDHDNDPRSDTNPGGGTADPLGGAPPGSGGPPGGTGPPVGNGPRDPERPGRPVITPCPAGHSSRPLPVTIGVIVSIQSLLGYSDAPGQLADRSALVPADLARDLAAQPGTLFYRLLTDADGNLLQVNEIGRFPSRKLGAAITLRDGGCTSPICTVGGHRCDLDHIVPAPQGPTTAANLNGKCRGDHRAKTHAGHFTSRDDHHRTTTWTTPTGHVYTTHDDPLPVRTWPLADPRPPIP